MKTKGGISHEENDLPNFSRKLKAVAQLPLSAGALSHTGFIASLGLGFTSIIEEGIKFQNFAIFRPHTHIFDGEAASRVAQIQNFNESFVFGGQFEGQKNLGINVSMKSADGGNKVWSGEQGWR